MAPKQQRRSTSAGGGAAPSLDAHNDDATQLPRREEREVFLAAAVNGVEFQSHARRITAAISMDREDEASPQRRQPRSVDSITPSRTPTTPASSLVEALTPGLVVPSFQRKPLTQRKLSFDCGAAAPKRDARQPKLVSSAEESTNAVAHLRSSDDDAPLLEASRPSHHQPVRGSTIVVASETPSPSATEERPTTTSLLPHQWDGHSPSTSPNAQREDALVAPAQAQPKGPSVAVPVSDDDADVVEIVAAPPSSTLRSSGGGGGGLSERERILRLRRDGRLTSEALSSLGTINPTFDDGLVVNDYVTPGVLKYTRGTTSQFRPSPGMPPSAVDSCETFSCVCVSLFAAMSEYRHLRSLYSARGLNYITYAAAWLHEISKPLWSRNADGTLKKRPTVADVSLHARISMAFPGLSFVPQDFTPLFYHQREAGIALIEQLLQADVGVGQRRRRGYVVVTGDLSFGVVSLEHLHPSGTVGGWSLVLTDSHGELPWAKHNTTLNVVNFSVDDRATDTEMPRALSRAEGVRHFCRILFALMEHCREHQNPHDVQYSTWVPLEEVVGRARMAPRDATRALDYTCIRGLISENSEASAAFQRAVATKPSRGGLKAFFEISPLSGVPVAPLACWVTEAFHDDPTAASP